MLKLRHYSALASEAQYRCRVSKKHAKRKPRVHGKVSAITGEAAQAHAFQAAPVSIVVNRQDGSILRHDNKAGIIAQVFNQTKKGKRK